MYLTALEDAHVAFRTKNFGVAYRALQKASAAATEAGDPRAAQLATMLADLEPHYHRFGQIWQELLELAPSEAEGADTELRIQSIAR
jgi:hypothetical protein